jgi:hypothetical protein
MQYDEPQLKPDKPGYHWARNRLGSSYEMVRVDDTLQRLWAEPLPYRQKRLDNGPYTQLIHCPVSEYYDFISLPVPVSK